MFGVGLPFARAIAWHWGQLRQLCRLAWLRAGALSSSGADEMLETIPDNRRASVVSDKYFHHEQRDVGAPGSPVAAGALVGSSLNCPPAGTL